jgi:hypothetical protein
VSKGGQAEEDGHQGNKTGEEMALGKKFKK